MSDSLEELRRAVQATAEQRHREIDREQAALLRAARDVHRGLRTTVICTCTVNGVPRVGCDLCGGCGEIEAMP